MSTAAASLPHGKADVALSKKRKGKGEGQKSVDLSKATEVVQRASSTASRDDPANVNGSKEYESPYLKELYKSMRNVSKKLNAASKVETIAAESPEQTLDQLVASRKINADQKAQIQKIPSLQASFVQLEDQVAQYKKFDQEHQARLDAEKASLEALHEKEKLTLKQAVEDAKAEGWKAAKAEERANLAVLTQFLRAAAAKRMEEELAGEAESRAFEGVLLLVYGGDEGAIQAVEKLISGSADPVMATDGSIIQNMTYADVKHASLANGGVADTLQANSDVETVQASENIASIKTDPTMANAGLTELEDTPIANGVEGVHSIASAPAQTDITADAANAAAEEKWDPKMTASSEGPDGWVEVSRDPAETDTGLDATPLATTGTQSWADDHPSTSAAERNTTPPSTTSHANAANDGFHEVHHSRGSRGRGSFQGERGGFRGRGNYRSGDGAGYRGRGGYRGDRGGDRGFRGRGRGRGMRDMDHQKKEAAQRE